MPVTARLSKLFYDRLGEEIAEELVSWFNQIDATYRADLREFNELNFARFDAKLEQRLVELDARWGGRSAALEAKLEQRLVELDAKWEGRSAALEAKLEQRFADLDAKWEGRSAALEAKLEQGLATLNGKIDRVAAELRETLERGLKEQVRWFFLAWATLLLAIIGLWMRPIL